MVSRGNLSAKQYRGLDEKEGRSMGGCGLLHSVKDGMRRRHGRRTKTEIKKSTAEGHYDLESA